MGRWLWQEEDVMRHHLRLEFVTVLAILVSLGAAPAAKVAPGTASGTLSIDGKVVALKHAYAGSRPNPFHEDQRDTLVLLTETALAPGAVGDLEEASSGPANSVLFAINAKGESILEVVHHASLGGQHLRMSGFTNATYTAGPVTKGTISGAFATKHEEDFAGHKYVLAVTFNAKLVNSRAPLK
jgi:hypothetical protein